MLLGLLGRLWVPVLGLAVVVFRICVRSFAVVFAFDLFLMACVASSHAFLSFFCDLPPLHDLFPPSHDLRPGELRENSGRTVETIEKVVAWSVSSAQQAQVRVQFLLYVAVELVLDDKLADE